MARELVKTAKGPLVVAIEADMAKALGHALSLLLPSETPILCIDRVRLSEDSYLDVGAPVGPCLPVVVKTLVLAGKQ
jgi:ethanolamine utilization protein EutA (predicted chaperonin)